MEQDKQKLINSFLAEKAASLANAKKSIKNSEIAKAIKHNKTIDNILKKLKLILELLTDMEEYKKRY
jgi:lipoprotein Spr